MAILEEKQMACYSKKKLPRSTRGASKKENAAGGDGALQLILQDRSLLSRKYIITFLSAPTRELHPRSLPAIQNTKTRHQRTSTKE
jgi:hypothetical protein